MPGNILSENLTMGIESLPLTKLQLEAQYAGVPGEISHSKEAISLIREIIETTLSIEYYQNILNIIRKYLMIYHDDKPIEERIVLGSIVKKILKEKDLVKELEDNGYIAKNAIEYYLSQISMDDNTIR